MSGAIVDRAGRRGRVRGGANRRRIVVAEDAPVEEYFPGWAAGRSWTWPADASDFTITNYIDNGSGQLILDAEFSEGLIFTDATDLAAAEVLVKFIAEPQGVLSITNIEMRPTIRRQDSSNYWWVSRTFGDGFAQLSPSEKIAGSTQPSAAFATGLDNTDAVTPQWIRMQLFHDVIRAKTWFDDDPEPADWYAPTRLRPSYGFANTTTGPTLSSDNVPETGAAGLTANYGGTILELTVTELTRSDPQNLYFNSKLDPDLVDTAGKPFFWFWDPKWNSETTGIVELVEDVVGPDGSTLIPCLRLARSTPGSGGDGPEAIQQFFLAERPGADRQRPTPSPGTVFPAQVDWSVWIKRVSMANAAPAVGSIAEVNYYFNAAGDSGSGSNTAPGVGNSYFQVLGSNTGSEGWTRYTGTLTIHGYADVVRLDRYLGIHDQAATGEMWIAGGDWAPTFEIP